MERVSRDFDRGPELEPVVGTEHSLEQRHRAMGHAALDASDVVEPQEGEGSSDVSRDLGNIALKNY